MTVRTRFAPSPTGSLHVGGARTALYCLLVARQTGGRFLLRIEDTDQARSTEAAAHGLVRDLRWLGLDWDEGPDHEEAGTGPYFQSQRLDVYRVHLDALRAAGHVYEAWETPAELEALRAAAAEAKTSFRYKRRPYTDADLEAFRAQGRVPVLRLAAPAHDIVVDDAILGPVHVAATELEDIVVGKADGFPTYHFAVVIDDHLMGVTQILRGQEHLMNTPKHLGLYEALGWTPPSHGHLPLIFNPSGSKMSKRDKAKTAREAARQAIATGTSCAALAARAGLDVDVLEAFLAKKHDEVATAEALAAALGVELPMIEVMDFRKRGYLPEALLNYLALLGWSPGDDTEFFTLDGLIARFSVAHVNTSPARFDAVKLTSINADHIRAATIDRLLDVQDAWIEVVPTSVFATVDRALRSRVLALYQARLTTLADLDRAAAWVLRAPTDYDASAVAKHIVKTEGWIALAAARGALEGTTWTAVAIDEALATLSAANNLPMGKLAQPIRIALTGTAVSPGIGESLALLDRDDALARLDRALAAWTP
jgi:glutamyl-tRNA synthetase